MNNHPQKSINVYAMEHRNGHGVISHFVSKFYRVLLLHVLRFFMDRRGVFLSSIRGDIPTQTNGNFWNRTRHKLWLFIVGLRTAYRGQTGEYEIFRKKKEWVGKYAFC